MAALGTPSWLDDEDEYVDPILTRQDAIDAGLNPDEVFPRKKQFFKKDTGEEWREKPPEFSKPEGKAALDHLRITPQNMEYYTVAPAQGTTGESYAYVDIGTVYDIAEKDSRIMKAVVESEGFYEDWTIKEQYKYVFGSLTFWGTYRDPENPNSTKMAPTIDGVDIYGRDIKINLLPLAWSVSLENWTNRFVNLQARLKQYPEKRKEILAEAGLTESEYKEMSKNYDAIINSMGSGAIVDNPDYKPTEEK